MQMSYQDFSGENVGRGNSSAVPAWAARANEPLVPAVDLTAINRSVSADLKELRRSADLLANLGAGAKKRPESAQTVGAQLLSISAKARERARATSRTLREALGIAEEGTAEHRALTALSDEFKHALIKFQQQVEATTHLVPPVMPMAGAAAASGDIETGGGDGGWSGSAVGENGARGPSDAPTGGEIDEVHEQQMAQVETNEQILAEREQGISQINRSVQQVAEIFQDLALLVNEQGTHIDNIQTNIEVTHTNTTRGVKELGRAARTQRKTRGRMCVMAACVLVVLIVLVLIIKIKPWG